jgi:transposase
MKKLATDTRNSIVSLLNTGFSARQIAVQLGISRGSVDRIRNEVMPNANKSAGGRPSALSAQDQRSLVRWATSGRADTAVQLQQELLNVVGVKVCSQTVRNSLKEAGLKAVVKKKKPLLFPRHIRQRLTFARKYQHWTEHDWFRVVFSDETKINRLGSDGRQWPPMGMENSRHKHPTAACQWYDQIWWRKLNDLGLHDGPWHRLDVPH